MKMMIKTIVFLFLFAMSATSVFAAHPVFPPKHGVYIMPNAKSKSLVVPMPNAKSKSLVVPMPNAKSKSLVVPMPNNIPKGHYLSVPKDKQPMIRFVPKRFLPKKTEGKSEDPKTIGEPVSPHPENALIIKDGFFMSKPRPMMGKSMYDVN